MTRKRYKALILDMDGTLLNSERMVVESLDILAAEYGVAMTPELYRRGFGCASEALVEEMGIADPARATDRWWEIMVDMMHAVPLFEGVAKVLAAPIRRGVVTSQIRAELAMNIARLHLEQVFECTVCADDTPFTKPHPRPLLYCLERMGLAADEALFVGDSAYDYGCALAAGVDFGLATWGADPAAGFPEARYRFGVPGEMLELVAKVEPAADL